MSTPILATKLYLPPIRSDAVGRQRLVERMNDGLRTKLTLISAPAGFGKTTLVCDWAANCGRPVAWLSLDEGDSDPIRFLTYLISALQTIPVGEAKGNASTIGEGAIAALQSPQPPPTEAILTALLNEIVAIPEEFTLVLDDYHVLDAKAVDDALVFLLEHLPPQMHMVITTREDPPIPLARYRARAQLTELRATDLRFTPVEAADFLNQAMNLNLTGEEITALETRTEGWIAGLQMAAISLQGRADAADFIRSFTGSHRFVLDYLAEEVLLQQPANVQTFLLRTSILDRLCGPLCDSLLANPLLPSQEMLEYLEQANLFVMPLDDERRWYRYHRLFADLLQQRLRQRTASSAGNEGLGDEGSPNVLHTRASQWYEDDGQDIEAFHHAVAADDFERAARRVEGEGMPLIFRGGAAPVLNWLRSLPPAIIDTKPSLWVIYASALVFAGDLAGVEAKLQAAEVALQGRELDAKSRDNIGHIAAIRATLAVVQSDIDAIVFQSLRALEYLHPDNLPVRTATTWTLGVAYQLQGDRTAAGQAYGEAIAISQVIGHTIITIMATTGLAHVQETENQLSLAAETYRSVLPLAGEPPLPVTCGAHLGLARVHYEWNDLDAAEEHGQQSVHLARQLEQTDRYIACEVLLARLKLARGDVAGAAAILAETARSARQHGFVMQLSDVAAAQVQILVRQHNLESAAKLAEAHELPLSRARVHLAKGNAPAALAVLEPLICQAEAKGWADEKLKVMVLLAVAHHAHGDVDEALRLLDGALALAAPGGFIRLFVDEGPLMARLLSAAQAQGIMADYVGTLLAAFSTETYESEEVLASPSASRASHPSPLIEPLSEREQEVLQLIAQGLSNREICERLFLALSTVKGHNRNIYGKLQVHRRTEAVARARELGLV